MEQKNNILTLTYEFLKMMTGVLKHFPRDQKFLLADRMHNHISDILELFIEAWYTQHDKSLWLQQANIKLEKLRYYVRLAYELGFYNSVKYRIIMEKIQEIGRMNGG